MRQNFKRPVSAVLAAIMLMSTVSTTAIAFAEDGANLSSSTSVVESVTPESTSAVPEENLDSSSVPEDDFVYPDSTGNGEGEASASTSESTPEQASSTGNHKKLNFARRCIDIEAGHLFGDWLLFCREAGNLLQKYPKNNLLLFLPPLAPCP